MAENFDYIIIGAGAAGLTSGQYGARAGLKTLIIDSSSGGGQALQIAELENYPGLFPLVSGSDFSEKMLEQTKAFGTTVIQDTVLSIDKINDKFTVKTQKEEFQCYAVLIATGAKHNTLQVPGEKALCGAGVSYCATCDGPFFKNKKIIVVGGGDSACSEAVYLSTISKDVTLIHRRGTLRAQKAVQDKLLNSGVTVRFNSQIESINGKNKVESVTLKDSETENLSEIPADAVFIFAGTTPVTDLVEMLPKDENGYLLTDECMQTIIPGLYAAGDVRSKPFRQLVTAAADGATAAFQATNYIHGQKLKKSL